MSNDQFTDRMNRELRKLARHEDDLAKRIDVMQRDRAATRARTTELTRLLAVYQEMVGLEPADDDSAPDESEVPTVVPGQTSANLEPSPPVGVHVETTNGVGTPTTTADIAEAFMAAHGGRAKIRDVLDELIRIGKLSGKVGDYGSVFGALKRNPTRFVKVGAGEFALVGGVGSADGGAH